MSNPSVKWWNTFINWKMSSQILSSCHASKQEPDFKKSLTETEKKLLKITIELFEKTLQIKTMVFVVWIMQNIQQPALQPPTLWFLKLILVDFPKIWYSKVCTFSDRIMVFKATFFNSKAHLDVGYSFYFGSRGN